MGPLTIGGVGLVIALLSIVFFMKTGRFEKHLQSIGLQKKRTRSSYRFKGLNNFTEICSGPRSLRLMTAFCKAVSGLSRLHKKTQPDGLEGPQFCMHTWLVHSEKVH
jgi:hypothetical protein